MPSSKLSLQKGFLSENLDELGGRIACSRSSKRTIFRRRRSPVLVASIARRRTRAASRLISTAAPVYPAEQLRRLGDAGAWGSHRPQNGAADLRCAIQSRVGLLLRFAARPPSWRGARIRWSGTR